MARRWWNRARHAAAACGVYHNPATRFLDYLGWTPRGEIREVRLRNGLRLKLRLGTNDLSIVDEIFAHGIYNRLLRDLRPGDVVLDVGAQSGVFALAAAARGATVRCYEPLQDNFELLLENIALNGYGGQITAQRVAVSDVSGILTLYTLDGETGGATFHPAIHPAWLGDQRVRAVEVECITLNDLVGERNGPAHDCLKLDCEGAEYAIIKNANPSVLQRIRTLILEYHPNGDVATIARTLGNVGFQVDVSERPCILYATSRPQSDGPAREHSAT